MAPGKRGGLLDCPALRGGGGPVLIQAFLLFRDVRYNMALPIPNSNNKLFGMGRAMLYRIFCCINNFSHVSLDDAAVRSSAEVECGTCLQ